MALDQVRSQSGPRRLDMAVDEGVSYQPPSSFSSFSEYGRAILDTPRRLYKHAWDISTPTDEMSEV